ncbi:MAG: hypothetical protein ABJF23_19070 [Bryobacteraceae bacterium]
MLKRLWIGLAAFSLLVPAYGAEADALAIEAAIKARHLPFGTILDPIYASATSTEIVGYTRCGDSALWTGAYLAAESFRYKVTQSADALANVNAALAGLAALTDVTGNNRLARCMVRANSPFAGGIAGEETSHTIGQNPPWIWIDDTSRDQLVGAYFGVAVAYDMVDDVNVKKAAGDLATRWTGFVSRHQWSPNDDIGNTFQTRPEQLQMLLQVTRHVDPSNTVSGPFIVLPTRTGVTFDVQSLDSYFKFNLDYLTFYNLVRIQDNGDNRDAYQIVRNYTASHQNPFFNLVDRALRGPDATRDAETRRLLDQWLQRQKRDVAVDLSKSVTVCNGRACDPIPVAMRPPTDFLWQRDPFQLKGGGSGLIESPGVDYILPYWMARYYGVIPGDVQSAAAVSATIAPNSLASFYFTNPVFRTESANTQPLPTTLGGVTLTVTDSAGTQRNAPLVYVSPSQINFVVPEGTAPGPITIAATAGAASSTATATVTAVAPTLFSANGSGTGVAAATAIRVQIGNPALQAPVTVFQCANNTCTPVPIQLGIDTPIYLTLYGTGIRNRSSLDNVKVNIKGVATAPSYAGPTPGFTGLDQVNVPLNLNLRGAGAVDVTVSVDGQTSNTVTIAVQ